MKHLIGGLILTSLLWVGSGQVVLATHGGSGGGEPVAGCAPGFDLHHIHEGAHDHDHIGSDYDKNGDGYLCVKHPAGKHHLHIDNNVGKNE